MKVLVLDCDYKRWEPGKVPGGAEKAALNCAKALGADFYTKSLPEWDDHFEKENVWQGSYLPRAEWPTMDKATLIPYSRYHNKNRERDILDIVLDGRYDLVINNSSSASHVNALTRLRKQTGVTVVNFCHLSFAVGSFPRFALVKALHELEGEGGINLTTCETINEQVADMIVKKHEIIGVDLQDVRVPFFHGVLHPSSLDHVPDLGIAGRQRSKVFAMCRFADDKNAKGLVKILIEFRKLGVPVEVHFGSGGHTDSALDDLWQAQKTLKAAGVIVEIDYPQQKSFDVARSALLHVTASHTECFGIVPCEMAAMGVPTAYLEKGKPHVLRSILHDYGHAFDAKTFHKHDLLDWARSFDDASRVFMADDIREEYSSETFEKRLREACDMAMANKRLPTVVDF